MRARCMLLGGDCPPDRRAMRGRRRGKATAVHAKAFVVLAAANLASAAAYADGPPDSGALYVAPPPAPSASASGGTGAGGGKIEGPMLRVEEGRVAGQHGDLVKAEQAFREAIAMAPTDTRVALAVGAAYYALGRGDEAIRIWTEALDVRRAPDLLFNLGIAYRSKSLFAQAIACFEEVIADEPSPPTTRSFSSRTRTCERTTTQRGSRLTSVSRRNFRSRHPRGTTTETCSSVPATQTAPLPLTVRA